MEDNEEDDYRYLIDEINIVFLQKEATIKEMESMERRIKGLSRELNETEFSYSEICNKLVTIFSRLQKLSARIEAFESKWDNKKQA